MLKATYYTLTDEIADSISEGIGFNKHDTLNCRNGRCTPLQIAEKIVNDIISGKFKNN